MILIVHKLPYIGSSDWCFGGGCIGMLLCTSKFLDVLVTVQVRCTLLHSYVSSGHIRYVILGLQFNYVCRRRARGSDDVGTHWRLDSIKWKNPLQRD